MGLLALAHARFLESEGGAVVVRRRGGFHAFLQGHRGDGLGKGDDGGEKQDLLEHRNAPKVLGAIHPEPGRKLPVGIPAAEGHRRCMNTTPHHCAEVFRN